MRITKARNFKPIVAHWKAQHEVHAIDREKVWSREFKVGLGEECGYELCAGEQEWP